MTRPPFHLIEGGHKAPGIGAALEMGAIGAALTWAVTCLARLPDWFHDLGRFQIVYAVIFALYALALMRMRRWDALPGAGWGVLAVAIATRAALLPVPPSLSGDLYRYVWEGRVLAHGFDPWRHVPADPALAHLRDGVIYPFVNHPDLAAIYPPLALLGDALVVSMSPTVLAMKLWIVLHDVALVGVLIAWLGRRGENGASALVYAWNPLVLVEYAGSGHNDPTGMLWLALALMWADEGPMASVRPMASARPVASALALAVGALTKLAPLMALPFLFARWPWRARLAAALPLAAGLAFYVAVTRGASSGLGAYVGTWSNNALAFEYLARAAGDARARVIAAALVVAVIGIALARRFAPERATLQGFRAALLVSPVLHPWYLGWVLMFEPVARSAPWLLLSLTAVLNYGVLRTPAAGRAFHLSLPWRWLEYGLPVALALVLAVVARRSRPPRLRGIASAA